MNRLMQSPSPTPSPGHGLWVAGFILAFLPLVIASYVFAPVLADALARWVLPPGSILWPCRLADV